MPHAISIFLNFIQMTILLIFEKSTQFKCEKDIFSRLSNFNFLQNFSFWHVRAQLYFTAVSFLLRGVFLNLLFSLSICLPSLYALRLIQHCFLWQDIFLHVRVHVSFKLNFCSKCDRFFLKFYIAYFLRRGNILGREQSLQCDQLWQYTLLSQG